ncbi:MAG: hypothetical protein LBV34_26290 [Nocardiopsaceae bacterium]|jgi:hypothetical protein|nr:hypothetical protein [Nocardiopsaceae bacterium]
MARTAEPYRAVFRQLEQLVAPGDQITSRLWGLTGWSMKWWMVATELFAILLLLPFILGLPGLYAADMALCGSAGVLLSASWWTRSVLVIAITSQHQLLCCRISRPLLRKTITQAPREAAQFAGFRRGWLFSQLSYRGPGTGGKTVRLNIPAQFRQAAEILAGTGSTELNRSRAMG